MELKNDMNDFLNKIFQLRVLDSASITNPDYGMPLSPNGFILTHTDI